MDFGDHGEVAAIATIRGMCIPFFLIGFDGLQNFQLSFAGAWMNDASSGKFKIPVRQFQRIDVVRKLIGIESYAMRLLYRLIFSLLESMSMASLSVMMSGTPR